VTFATALKAFLRQDPNTILVGEVRDAETANIVLSTLHTSAAIGAAVVQEVS